MVRLTSMMMSASDRCVIASVFQVWELYVVLVHQGSQVAVASDIGTKLGEVQKSIIDALYLGYLSRLGHLIGNAGLNTSRGVRIALLQDIEGVKTGVMLKSILDEKTVGCKSRTGPSLVSSLEGCPDGLSALM